MTRHLFTSSSARPANSSAPAGERTETLGLLAGFERSRGTARAASPRRLANMLQRAVRLPSAKELAPALRAAVRRIWRLPPPAEAGKADPWRAFWQQRDRPMELLAKHGRYSRKWRQSTCVRSRKCATYSRYPGNFRELPNGCTRGRRPRTGCARHLMSREGGVHVH